MLRLSIKSGRVISWMDQEVSRKVLDICLCGYYRDIPNNSHVCSLILGLRTLQYMVSIHDLVILTDDVIASLGFGAHCVTGRTRSAVGFNVLFTLCGFGVSGTFSGQSSNTWLARMPESAAIDASLAPTILAHHILAFASIADLAKPATALRTFLKHFWRHKLFKASYK